MIEVKDRIPTKANRIKLTNEATGEVAYYTWERADEPSREGTPINAALFDSIVEDFAKKQNKVSYGKSLPSTLAEGEIFILIK